MIERVVIIALVSYRLAEALAIEYGPFDLFDRFRIVIDLRWAVEYDAEGNATSSEEIAGNFLAEMVQCLRCVTLIWGLGLSLLRLLVFLDIGVGQAVIEGLAASGLAVFIGSMTRGGVRWRID